jgi:hypothetical protein
MDYGVIGYDIIGYNVIGYNIMGHTFMGHNFINYNINYRTLLYTVISLYTGYSYYFVEDKVITSTIITSFYTLDLIFNKKIYNDFQYLIHHSLIVGLYLLFLYYKYYDFVHILINPLFGFQISTIFYNINELFVKNYTYNKYKYINLLCYISTFVYYRLYRYYYDVITHPDLNTFLEKYNKGIILIPYFFYTLNMFWLCIIIKKLMSPLKKIETEFIAEYFCQYILLLNIPVTFYKYIITKNNYILIDVFGNVILNIGSYLFHNNLMLYQLYGYPRNKCYFLLDNIGIRIKTLLTLLTYCLYKNDHYTYLYFNICYYLVASIISYILVYKSKNMDITKKYVIFWLSLDVFIGSLYLAYNYNQFNNMYIILVLLGTVYNCKIFYKITHIAFHILLLFHNFVLYKL